MKLTKDTLIEGDVYRKGTNISLKEEALYDAYGVDVYPEYMALLRSVSDLYNKTIDPAIHRTIGTINKGLEELDRVL